MKNLVLLAMIAMTTIACNGSKVETSVDSKTKEIIIEQTIEFDGRTETCEEGRKGMLNITCVDSWKQLQENWSDVESLTTVFSQTTTMTRIETEDETRLVFFYQGMEMIGQASYSVEILSATEIEITTYYANGTETTNTHPIIDNGDSLETTDASAITLAIN